MTSVFHKQWRDITMTSVLHGMYPHKHQGVLHNFVGWKLRAGQELPKKDQL